MKKLLLIIVLFCSGFATKASHLMGGEITVKYDTTINKYLAFLTWYRDTLGVALSTYDYVQIQMNNGSWTLVSSDSINKNVALSTSLIPNFPYGVEVGVYVDTINTLNTSILNRIIAVRCCRNAAILNMCCPVNQGICISADISENIPGNSSPQFLAMPIVHFAVNQPASYNPLAYDIDGDSISYELTVPSDAIGGIDFAYISSPVIMFSPPMAATGGPLTINPLTGEITWTPDTVGNFVQSIKVKEYKSGVQVGQIIRDVQFIVLPQGNNNPPYFQQITPYSYNSMQSYNYAYYLPGQNFQFQLNGLDSDANTTLSYTSMSSIFMMSNPATFSVTGTGGNKTGILNWLPPANFTSDVVVVFRIGDGHIMKDFTLVLKKGTVSINGINTNSISIFPNPTTGSITIKGIAQPSVAVYNLMGQKVIATQGSNEVSLAQLPTGMYLVQVYDKDGVLVKSEKVMRQ